MQFWLGLEMIIASPVSKLTQLFFLVLMMKKHLIVYKYNSNFNTNTIVFCTANIVVFNKYIIPYIFDKKYINHIYNSINMK